jgi:hypothetical protein
VGKGTDSKIENDPRLKYPSFIAEEKKGQPSKKVARPFFFTLTFDQLQETLTLGEESFIVMN